MYGILHYFMKYLIHLKKIRKFFIHVLSIWVQEKVKMINDKL